MSETYYFLYSKYSQACNGAMPLVQGFSNYINIALVDIDDKQTRSKLANTVIKTVPAIIVHAPDRIYVLEGQELQAFFQRIQGLIQQQQQQQQLLAANASTMLMQNNQVQSIAPPPNSQPSSSDNMSVAASINSRLTPQVITTPPPPPPMLSNQVASSQSVTATASQMQQRAQSASTNPMEAHAQAEAALQTAAMSQSQMQLTNSPDVQIIDASVVESDASLFNTDGAYTPEMIGQSSGNRAIGNPENRTSAIKSQAEQWMRDREDADKQFQRPMM